MRKPLLAAITALVIAAPGLSVAQQSPDRGPEAWQPSPQDRAAFLDARIAALKAGLALTPAQEKNWAPFEQAVRELAKVRAERMDTIGIHPPADPIERLRHRADTMTRVGTALKQLADAAEPLYQSLDDAQKRRFVVLARHLRPHMGHHRMGPERRDPERSR
jgi:zinc resistance-associated protein